MPVSLVSEGERNTTRRGDTPAQTQKTRPSFCRFIFLQATTTRSKRPKIRDQRPKTSNSNQSTSTRTDYPTPPTPWLVSSGNLSQWSIPLTASPSHPLAAGENQYCLQLLLPYAFDPLNRFEDSLASSITDNSRSHSQWRKKKRQLETLRGRGWHFLTIRTKTKTAYQTPRAPRTLPSPTPPTAQQRLAAVAEAL